MLTDTLIALLLLILNILAYSWEPNALSMFTIGWISCYIFLQFLLYLGKIGYITD